MTTWAILCAMAAVHLSVQARSVAKEVPAMGWRTYYLSGDAAAAPDGNTAARVNGEALENE